MTASYMKLKSGEWGIKTTARPSIGQSVTVTKRDGSAKTETITRVIWSGNDGVSICAIAAGLRSQSNNRYRPGYRANEPLGQTLSRYDRYGIYSGDGTKLGSSCGCIDYPCCGH